MSTADNFIPFIHNYCDRWCERCRFIMRCRIGVEEVKRQDGKKEDDGVSTSVETVAQNLKDALDMLEKMAKENGINWEELQQEIDESEPKERTYTNEQVELKEWGIEYLSLGRDWFAQNGDIINEKEEEINQKIEFGIEGTARQGLELLDAMEVIRWFLFFISVKMDRALYGLQSDWIEGDDPIQNDANGSAKVALDAIERSLGAWEVIRKHFPDHIDDFIDIFVLLGKMRKNLLQLFPNVEAFVRPGFDEPQFHTP